MFGIDVRQKAWSAGLIVLFFVWRDERPKTARQVIMISAVSFGISLLFYLASSMTAAAVGAY